MYDRRDHYQHRENDKRHGHTAGGSKKNKDATFSKCNLLDKAFIVCLKERGKAFLSPVLPTKLLFMLFI